MWYSSGDLNTKFYHALTKQRRVRNRIVGLHDETGNWITEEKGVEKVGVDYFDELFSTTSPLEFDSFLMEVAPSISFQMKSKAVESRNGGGSTPGFVYDAPGKSSRTGRDDNSFLPTLLAYYLKRSGQYGK